MKLLLIFTKLLLIFLPLKAQSCSCSGQLKFKNATQKAKYIFSGIIISEEMVFYENTVNGWILIKEEEAKQKEMILYQKRFRIELFNKYKGNIDSKIINVETPVGSNLCEFPFKVGSLYIIYTEEDILDNTFFTNSCDRTMKYSKTEHRKLKLKFKK